METKKNMFRVGRHVVGTRGKKNKESFAIGLPKVWTDDQKIKKGDRVNAFESPDFPNCLILALATEDEDESRNSQ
ncbi:MAG: hypothetical protein WC356_05065 [Candidatus Micrarchaeia archaeon]|jgi:hypothetical protein